MSPNPVSSTPVLRTALRWGLLVGLGVVVLAAVVGVAVGGADGLWSGVIGALVGVLFPALTAVSILVGNHWFGTPNYLQIFFGVVMGGWILKFVLVIVALLLLMRVEWLVTPVFYGALVAAAVASLVVDLVVLSRMRLPGVSDTTLPQTNPED
ncbi:hypothetical protein [Microbacterium hatanonis]|jgi:hypothetical protein|uniref:Uncharacterized protein n=1 Tax=Microbacterium hatanonis TaxID=404366 RepID=A0A5C8I048_9MICO|nr:hypothetical protein [Microbacterium hatanonis]TXK12498.1 hypothetical protein FVP77_03210 [Microbacterium hatanonis]